MTKKQFNNKISEIKDFINLCSYPYLNYYYENDFTFVVTTPIDSFIPTTIISSVPKGVNINSFVRASLPVDGESVLELVIILNPLL